LEALLSGYPGQFDETLHVESTQDLWGLVLFEERDDFMWQLENPQVPGDDGVILACLPGEFPDAPATHSFHLSLVVLSNQYRRTLESFLEHLMLADIPLGREPLIEAVMSGVIRVIR